MILVSYWQIVIYTIAIMSGVYWIVERRIKQNNNVVSEYIQIKDDKLKKFMGGILENIQEYNSGYEEELMDKLRETMDGYRLSFTKEVVAEIERVYGRNQEDIE